jgi:hypothetical protein
MRCGRTEMIRELEYFDTEIEAIAEGDRCKALLYGYGYRYRVYYADGAWVLDSERYSSCD